MRNFTVTCLSEAVAPISHMSGSSGNEAIIARDPVVTAHGVQHVPRLSGNQLRHRLVREPGARWIIGRYGLAGRLTLPQLNFFLHGGNLTEGGGREDTKRIADLQRLFPLLRLLGGCLPDQVLAGSLLASHGYLVCEENRPTLTAYLPDGWTMPEAPLRPAESFVASGQYTRGDARKTAADLLPEANGEPAGSQLMIFSGQYVVRGAAFLHAFTLQHCSRLELGALLLSLALWQEAGGTVGGQGARGHGRLRTAVYTDADDADTLVGEYVAHVDASRDDALAWLEAAFPARAAKGRGKRAEPAEVAGE